MTVEADLIQDRRRRFATPGGSHDRLIRTLLKVLPIGIGVIAAIMILSPLSPRGEIGFLLDRNKVAVTDKRIAVDAAMYRGMDGHGRAFRVLAGNAAQISAETPVVEMVDLKAVLDMADGPARISAPDGSYNYRTEQIMVDGPVEFSAADGYRMTTNNVRIDLDKQTAFGSGGVSGSVPTGSFSAESIYADLTDRVVRLEGNARLRMVPGKLKVPK
ncbi:MAG: LPS export ABC transporter periplasmic protein LptC [Novosphingobium sp.]|nr:LPS export ABC transporter periplasmic protein LptC [Novosphingobium sp.]